MTDKRYVEHVMGMPVTLVLRGRHIDDDAAQLAWAAVMGRLRFVDDVFSTYRPDSWLARIESGELALDQSPTEVAEALREVLALAEQARSESHGAFDVRHTRPDGHAVLDPSGVVKGWAVQGASAELRHLADTDFCLSAGGDMVCHVADDEGPPWRIGVEDPRDAADLVAIVPLRRGAIATSSLLHRGNHIVDPRSGRVPRGLTSVTVLAEDLTWADIDATAAFVLGEEGLDWLRARGRNGVVVDAGGAVTAF